MGEPAAKYCGFSVKRSVFGFIATAVAIMILFSPGPSGGDGGTDSQFGQGFRVGRIMAPAFDASDVKDQDVGKLIRDPRPTLLVGLIVELAFTTLFRLIVALTESPCGHWLLPALGSRPSRAPPWIVL